MARRPRKTLEIGDVTVVVDNKEGLPYDLAPLRQVKGTLPTGDYSVVGLEHLVSVERKSLTDLLGCVGTNRDRFDREMQRILSYPQRLLLIESSWHEIERGDWRSHVTVEAAIGSILAWQRMAIPVELAGDRERAAACRAVPVRLRQVLLETGRRVPRVAAHRARAWRRLLCLRRLDVGRRPVHWAALRRVRPRRLNRHRTD